jgi:NAD(P)-dependent dehydrogenase (short-subunit alcohol dehydrogenase family)
MAVELNQFGIGMKVVEPGRINTDFFTRSLDTGRHPAYDALVDKVMSVITDPKQMATYSTPEQVAEVVYEAAADGRINSGTSLAQMEKQPMPSVYRWETRLSARRSISSRQQRVVSA